MCFSSGRLPNNLHFTYGHHEIEINKEFYYLNVLLTKTENFKMAIKSQADKVAKAILGGKFHNLELSSVS
jgi:hypothetical protein